MGGMAGHEQTAKEEKRSRLTRRRRIGGSWHCQMPVYREKCCDRDACLDLKVCPKMTCNRFRRQRGWHEVVSRGMRCETGDSRARDRGAW